MMMMVLQVIKALMILAMKVMVVTVTIIYSVLFMYQALC